MRNGHFNIVAPREPVFLLHIIFLFFLFVFVCLFDVENFYTPLLIPDVSIVTGRERERVSNTHTRGTSNIDKMHPDYRGLPWRAGGGEREGKNVFITSVRRGRTVPSLPVTVTAITEWPPLPPHGAAVNGEVPSLPHSLT